MGDQTANEEAEQIAATRRAQEQEGRQRNETIRTERSMYYKIGIVSRMTTNLREHGPALLAGIVLTALLLVGYLKYTGTQIGAIDPVNPVPTNFTVKTRLPYATDTGMFRRLSIMFDNNKELEVKHDTNGGVTDMYLTSKGRVLKANADHSEWLMWATQPTK
jgi:hypothetical protein